MEVPARFQSYACADYFASQLLAQGVWSEAEQLWLIVSAKDVTERIEDGFLVIGRPGVDGIEFGYRRDCDGVWAYYPLEARYELLAENTQALVDGWFSGTIKV